MDLLNDYRKIQDARISAETVITRARKSLNRLDWFYSNNEGVKWDHYKGRRDAITYGMASVEDTLGAPQHLEVAAEALDKQLDALDEYMSAPPPAPPPANDAAREAHEPHSTCGALCKCLAKGQCSRVTDAEMARGCIKPPAARGGYVVWGHNGVSYPGRIETRCACGGRH